MRDSVVSGVQRKAKIGKSVIESEAEGGHVPQFTVKVHNMHRPANYRNWRTRPSLRCGQRFMYSISRLACIPRCGRTGR